MNILFDFDGTIIDSGIRLYRLFCDIISQNKLSFEDYWNFKRSMVNHETILTNYFQYTKEEYFDFEKKWMTLIESDTYLNYDKVFDFTVNVLQTLKSNKYNLYLITARQSQEKVIMELNKMELFYFFKDILVTENKKSKLDLIKESKLQLSNNDILVGDTGLDIQTAKDLNLISIAVLSGFRNKEVLEKYLPDYIIADIQVLIDLLGNKYRTNDKCR